MELIKRIVWAAFSALKGFIGLIPGRDEKAAKALTLIAALFFIATCAVKSLNALAIAERVAAYRQK